MKLVFDENGLAITPGELKCFYYNPETREYSGWSNEYINVGVSMPGNCTDIDPGEYIVGMVYLFNGARWQLEKDYRGVTVYSMENKAPSVVDYIGPIKEGFVAIEPLSMFDKWDGKTWVKNAEAEYTALVSDADAQKQYLITQANDYINRKQWPGKAVMGRLSDTEKAQYSLWLDYLDILEAVDTSNAPEINWPTPPKMS
ncbi:TPA: tail fiber assembly protein [Escherichia coli]|uniref:tail fiber assembly protein n=1 Tax=Escherichia coli TaxID=562 RepID=UPI001ADAC155|nr:tail fiber assembly protein [Escherichia coli]MBO9280150.1 tail fiber assembly protein [Escherichia coli]MBO9293039.1 tail fiber assembly protein [Escherichia coli]